MALCWPGRLRCFSAVLCAVLIAIVSAVASPFAAELPTVSNAPADEYRDALSMKRMLMQQENVYTCVNYPTASGTDQEKCENGNQLGDGWKYLYNADALTQFAACGQSLQCLCCRRQATTTTTITAATEANTSTITLTASTTFTRTSTLATVSTTTTTTYTSSTATTATISYTSSTATTATNTDTSSTASTATNTYTVTSTATTMSTTPTSVTSSYTSSSTQSLTKTTATSTSSSATFTSYTSTSFTFSTSTSATLTLTSRTMSSMTSSSSTTTTTTQITNTTTSITTTYPSTTSSSSTSTASSSTTEYTTTRTIVTSSTSSTATTFSTTTLTSTSASSTLTFSMTTTSTRWPQARVVGTIQTIVMNAFSLLRDDFAVLAFRQGISLLARVDITSVKVVIEPVEGISTKATINFIIAESRLSEREADLESKRLSALFDSVSKLLVTSKLREGLRMRSVDMPLQVLAMTTSVTLLLPGEDEAQRVEWKVLAPQPQENYSQVSEDGGSGARPYIALCVALVSSFLHGL